MKVFIFFLFILLLAVEGLEVDKCREEKCSRRGPTIRFPFRLKDPQHKECGYHNPAFELSCKDGKHTELELTNSLKVYVKEIDYESQTLQVYGQDDCLPREARNLNLTGGIFRFVDDCFDYALYSCPLENRDEYVPVRCLGGHNYQVYAFESSRSIDDLPLTSCTKKFNVSSLPRELFDDQGVVRLNWSEPDCHSCEKRGQLCSWKNKTITCLKNESKERADAVRKEWIACGVVGSFISLVAAAAILSVYRTYRKEKAHQARIEKFLEDYRALKPTRYSYSDLKAITNDFKDKLGQGAYGAVYKGKLSTEIHVAVKILNSSMGNGEEFINEVGTMGRIHHVNVVRLVGFCADGFRRALVYEFLPNESLEKFIFPTENNSNSLGWGKLEEIAVGIAKGIEYLHQGCDQRILHFDIKPHNILLDDSFTPKISDFGLAKLCAKDQSAVSMTAARGTMGYIAPEVFSRNFGNVSYKSDVYSFGMLLLEMVGGRRTINVNGESTSQVFSPEWLYQQLCQGEELRIRILEVGDAKIAKKLTVIGLWCIQWYPADRPSMKVVVQMLEGEGDDLPMPPNPFNSANSTNTEAGMRGRRLHQELAAISEME